MKFDPDRVPCYVRGSEEYWGLNSHGWTLTALVGSKPLMSKTSVLRYLGNFLLIIGYQTMLWGDFKYGLILKSVGGLLTVPFAIKLKLWDVLFLYAFFGITEIIKCATFLGFLKSSGGVKRPLRVSYFSQEQVVRMGLSPAWFPISSQRIGGEAGLPKVGCINPLF